MNTPTQDRVAYSYDEIFPERFLHAPDLDGKTVTLTITDIWGEYIQNPKQKRKKERGDLCGVLSFQKTKREYAMSKQNAWIIKALWGKDPANIVGKRITISAVPDTSGFTDHNTRILFTGSPDIDGDRAFTLPGGQQMTFRKTVAGGQTIVEGAAVDPATGEVADEYPLQTPEAAQGTAQAAFDDAGGSVEPQAALEPETAPEDESEFTTFMNAAETEPPGRGPLRDVSDPDRPASAADKAALSKALAGVDAAKAKKQRAKFGGRSNSDLTHAEAEELRTWALGEATS